MSKSVLKAEKIRGDSEDSIVITLTDSGFEIAEGWGSKIFYSWNDVSELSVEGPDTIQKRITASRLLLTGVFAFALKKKTGEAFVFIDFKNSGDALVLRFPKKSEPEIKAFFAPFKSKITNLPLNTSSNSGPDTIEQLEKLSALFEKKLIDEAEFKASKAKILGLSDQ